MTSSASELLTKRIVSSHLAGLSSARYEIGIFDPAAQAGDGQMLLRQWTLTEVLDSIDWLRFRNANGNAIYVRPHGEHAYTLVDDLTSASLKKLTPDYEPAVTVETSPGNFQAWLYAGEVMPAALGSRVASRLAATLGGDIGAAAWNQFGRLAGFTNNKAKYKQPNGMQPFVRLRHSKRVTYAQVAATLAGAAQDLELEAAEARRFYSTASRTPNKDSLRTIESFHEDQQYGGDLTRADLAYALYACSRGVCVDDIAATLGRRPLSHKGSAKRQQDYIHRTIQKAALYASR